VTEIGTGNPVPNHTVYMWFDSTAGIPLQSTTTNASGFYTMSVQISFQVGSGIGEVYTTDCQQFIHQVPFQYSPNITAVAASFNICNNFLPSCQSSFSWNQTPLGPVFFTDQSTSSSGNVNSWYWDFGDGNTSTLQNPNHTYANPGLYVACLTIGTTQGCQSTFCDSIQVTGQGQCQAAFTYNVSGNTVNFSDASTTSSPVNYSWSFGDGSGSGLQNPSHTYNSSGTYAVCLTIFDSLGNCQSTYCDSVTLQGS